MAEGAQKPRWGRKALPVDPHTTVPDQTAAPGPEASAEGEALAVEQPGHYQVKRELARGGQAVVMIARDRQIGRDVAFKLLLPGGAKDAEDRFLREARVAGQLEHPGVVPVYELCRRAGGGGLYGAFRLVRGWSLAWARRA